MHNLTQDPHYQRVAPLVNTIADWVNRYRRWRANDQQFAKCSADEVFKMARDLGLALHELEEVARKGPDSARLIERLLKALGVEAIAHQDEAVLNDLKRLCAFCDQKGRCTHELAATSAAEHFRQYCPNAFTLDALITEKGIQQHRH